MEVAQSLIKVTCQSCPHRADRRARGKLPPCWALLKPVHEETSRSPPRGSVARKGQSSSWGPPPAPCRRRGGPPPAHAPAVYSKHQQQLTRRRLGDPSTHAPCVACRTCRKSAACPTRDLRHACRRRGRCCSRRRGHARARGSRCRTHLILRLRARTQAPRLRRARFAPQRRGPSEPSQRVVWRRPLAVKSSRRGSLGQTKVYYYAQPSSRLTAVHASSLPSCACRARSGSRATPRAPRSLACEIVK